MNRYSVTPELDGLQKSSLAEILEKILESPTLESPRRVYNLDNAIGLYSRDRVRAVRFNGTWEVNDCIYIGTGKDVPVANKLGILAALMQLIETSTKLEELFSVRLSEYLVGEHNELRGSLIHSSTRAEGLAFSGEKVAALVDSVWMLPSGEEVDVSGEEWTVCSSGVPVKASEIEIGNVVERDSNEFAIGDHARVRSNLGRTILEGVISRVTVEEGLQIFTLSTLLGEFTYYGETLEHVPVETGTEVAEIVPSFLETRAFQVGDVVQWRDSALRPVVTAVIGTDVTVGYSDRSTETYHASELSLIDYGVHAAPEGSVVFHAGQRVGWVSEVGEMVGRIDTIVELFGETQARVLTDQGTVEIVSIRGLRTVEVVEPVVELVHGFPVGARVRVVNTTHSWPNGVVLEAAEYGDSLIVIRYDEPHEGQATGRFAPHQLELIEELVAEVCAIEPVPDVSRELILGFRVGARVRTISTSTAYIAESVVERLSESGVYVQCRDSRRNVLLFYPYEIELIPEVVNVLEQAFPNGSLVRPIERLRVNYQGGVVESYDGRYYVVKHENGTQRFREFEIELDPVTHEDAPATTEINTSQLSAQGLSVGDRVRPIDVTNPMRGTIRTIHRNMASVQYVEVDLMGNYWGMWDMGLLRLDEEVETVNEVVGVVQPTETAF